MKKLFKTSIWFACFASITTGIIWIGELSKRYQRKQEFTNPPKLNHNYADFLNKITKNESQGDLILNKYIFKENTIEKVDFLNKQSQISDTTFSEINSSLTFAPLFVYVSDSNRNEILGKYALRGSKKIKDILENNWYWYLNNIHKFTFQLNPFNWRFNDTLIINEETKESIKDVFLKQLSLENENQEIKDNSNLLFQLKELNIQKFHEIDFLEILPEEYRDIAQEQNKYKEGKILFWEDKTGVLLISYLFNIEHNNTTETKLFILPEILVPTNKTSDNVNNLISKIKEYYIDVFNKENETAISSEAENFKENADTLLQDESIKNNKYFNENEINKYLAKLNEISQIEEEKDDILFKIGEIFDSIPSSEKTNRRVFSRFRFIKSGLEKFVKDLLSNDQNYEEDSFEGKLISAWRLYENIDSKDEQINQINQNIEIPAYIKFKARQRIYQKHNDEVFMTLFNNENYSEVLYNSVLKFNKSFENKLNRFTLGAANEI
ncbi:hypothetical protein RRG58_04735 [Mycoplasmopsis cynos]|nr:hypothetical protein [Mycoplasmopsis felis]WQQ11749.1 hypothetical protein RRG50_00620 [Mycoplasmopsis felis]